MAAPSYFQPNVVYCGDCLDVLRKFPAESVNLIYADPPFFSEEGYEILWFDGYEKRAFEDRWKGGIKNYIAWMQPRLEECYRVLKKTGSMYLHCDAHADHRLRVIMDDLFVETNFINEIIWQRTSAHSNPRKSFGRLHDAILFYSKSKEYTWNTQFTPYSEEHLENSYRFVEKKTGRKYASRDLTASVYHAADSQIYTWKGKKPPASRVWSYTKEEMARLDKEGKIIYSKNGYPRLKLYLDESKGVPLQDIWTDIQPVQAHANERLGYPTQKPEVLLERIIKSSSNEGDLVLDPFCGCGTALTVAHKLKRKWIGIDISPTACNLMVSRLTKARAKPSLVGMPFTDEELRKLPPFEFQNWVIRRLFGRVSSRKSSDMGIDGYTFEGHPVQVKQSSDIGRNVVDNFETALRRAGKNTGVIVAFSFGRGAYEEIARARLEEKLNITAMKVSDLLKLDRDFLPDFTKTPNDDAQTKIM
ncbi:MAG: DNA methyltransferase [Nitrosopumilaceae archaeon]